MFHIAVIDVNKLRYSDVEQSVDKLVPDKIENDIEDYIEFINVPDHEEMMVQVVSKLGLDKDMVGHTTTCFEDNEYVYQLCHLVATGNETNMNYISMDLVRGKYKVIGKSVLIKATVQSDKTCKPVNITISDVVDIYMKTLIHTGVVLDINGDITEYKFCLNPVSHIHPNKINNIKFHEFKLFNDMVGQLFIEVKPDEDVLNKNASDLYGNKEIKGRAIFALRSMQNDMLDNKYDYYEMTKNHFTKLITFIRKLNSETTTTENKETKQDTVVDKEKPTEPQGPRKIENQKADNFYITINKI